MHNIYFIGNSLKLYYIDIFINLASTAIRILMLFKYLNNNTSPQKNNEGYSMFNNQYYSKLHFQAIFQSFFTLTFLLIYLAQQSVF